MNIEESKSYYKLAGLYNSTYYGLLANIKITKQSEFKPINLNEVNKNISKKFINKLNVLKLLSRADEQKYSLRFIKGLFHNKLTKTEILLMLDILLIFILLSSFTYGLEDDQQIVNNTQSSMININHVEKYEKFFKNEFI